MEDNNFDIPNLFNQSKSAWAPGEETKYWYRIGEAAKYLGVSIWTLRRWDKSGKLKAVVSPGKQRRYKKEDLDEILKLK